MGQSRTKQQSARDAAFSKTDRCVYCGGGTLATTVDHCPPRGIFLERNWPEGFVFPACAACNSGSRDEESLIAFMVRLNSTLNAEEDELFKRHVDRLARTHPEELQYLATAGASTKRRIARHIGVSPPPGSTYAELPLARLPERWKEVMRSFGEKLTKAVHFHELGRICPTSCHVIVEIRSNALDMASPLSEDLVSTMGRTHEIKRTKVDISDQFSYLTKRAGDGSVAMYVFSFNQSFSLMCFYADNRILLRDVEAVMRQRNEP